MGDWWLQERRGGYYGPYGGHDDDDVYTRCPECGHNARNGYCFYCGSGNRRQKTSAQRAANEARALELWAECQPLTGTLAEQYLRRERKITLPLPETVLRFHPRCPFDHRHYVPALV